MTQTPTVVVIDDEPLVCKTLGRIVQLSGASVVTFEDAHDAVRWLREHRPALILCDYRMPELSGLDVLEQVQPGPAFYLLTGELFVPEAQRDDRIAGIVHKPVRAEVLLQLLRSRLPRVSPGP